MRPSRPSSSVPRPALVRHRPPGGPVLALAAIVLAALAVAPAARAAEPATPPALDPVSPVAVAASGPTLAWLRPSDSLGTHARLVVRDAAGAAPRVVDRALPRRPISLTVGTDASGTAVAVVATAGTASLRPRPSRQPVQRGALYLLPLDGSAAPRRLPVSAPGTDLYQPGLLRGRLSFARLQRVDGRRRWTLRSATLTGRRSTLLARPAAGTEIDRTTPIRGGGVAYATASPDPESAGYRFALRTVRAGGRDRVISRTSIGGSAENETGFGLFTVSPDGGRLSAVRGTTGLQTWSVPDGRRRASVATGVANGSALLVGSEGLAVTGTDGLLRVVPGAG